MRMLCSGPSKTMVRESLSFPWHICSTSPRDAHLYIRRRASRARGGDVKTIFPLHELYGDDIAVHFPELPRPRAPPRPQKSKGAWSSAPQQSGQQQSLHKHFAAGRSQGKKTVKRGRAARNSAWSDDGLGVHSQSSTRSVPTATSQSSSAGRSTGDLHGSPGFPSELPGVPRRAIAKRPLEFEHLKSDSHPLRPWYNTLLRERARQHPSQ